MPDLVAVTDTESRRTGRRDDMLAVRRPGEMCGVWSLRFGHLRGQRDRVRLCTEQHRRLNHHALILKVSSDLRVSTCCSQLNTSVDSLCWSSSSSPVYISSHPRPPSDPVSFQSQPGPVCVPEDWRQADCSLSDSTSELLTQQCVKKLSDPAESSGNMTVV